MLTENDDRLRPAANLVLDFTEIEFSFFLWGRDFGPISERDYLVSFSKLYKFTNKLNMVAKLGGCLALAKIDTKLTEQLEEVNTNSDFNIGITAGIRKDIYNDGARVLSLAWDTHIFLAGQAAIFLATSRREMISLTFGVQL